jgi:hypothetical protein
MTPDFILPYEETAQKGAYAASRALIVRQPWADKILDGSKTWEIRGSATHVRGRIGIIPARSKMVSGYCNLVAVRGPLTISELLETVGLHAINREELLRQGPPYPCTYAWVLEQSAKLDRPIAYNHPRGAIIWVRLQDSA